MADGWREEEDDLQDENGNLLGKEWLLSHTELFILSAAPTHHLENLGRRAQLTPKVSLQFPISLY
jgi:hypothetical protein